MENSKADDLAERRADLKARIKAARAALAYVARQEKELVKLRIQSKKNKIARKKLAAFFPNAAAQDALEESSAATAAKTAAETRVSAVKALTALQAELDALK
jgi:hypothetical protein